MEKATTQNFDQTITSNKTVLVDFFATWCGPCKMLAPVVEQFAESETNVKVVKVDVDEEPNLAMRFGISSIPTLLVFKDGKLADKQIGYRSLEQLKQMVK